MIAGWLAGWLAGRVGISDPRGLMPMRKEFTLRLQLVVDTTRIPVKYGRGDTQK